MSPARIWIGATIAAIHIAIENMVRTVGLDICPSGLVAAGGGLDPFDGAALPRRASSRCHAPTPPTTSAVVR